MAKPIQCCKVKNIIIINEKNNNKNKKIEHNKNLIYIIL